MIEILDSNAKDYQAIRKWWIGCIISYNTIIPFYIFIILPLLGKHCEKYCIIGFIMCICTANPAFLYLFWDTKKKFTPAKHIRIIFSDSKIEIFLQDRLYFQQSKEDLKAIEIIKKKNFPDYDLNFIGTETKTIRFSCIMIHEKKRKELLENIKKWGENLNIPVNYQMIKKFYTKEYTRDKKTIQKWFKAEI
ncbi:MAG: hypothetical protein ACFFBH_12640 [Promethearchaeota archaeon]